MDGPSWLEERASHGEVRWLEFREVGRSQRDGGRGVWWTIPILPGSCLTVAFDKKNDVGETMSKKIYS